MRRLVLLALLGLLAAGCSDSKPGGKVVTPTPATVVGTLPTAPPTNVPVPPQYQHGDSTAGKTIFLTKGCKSCHTLADAGATGTIGPNLDEVKPPLGLVVDRVVHGKGAMPPFAGTLSTKQIGDVAAYVVKATSG